MKRSHDGEGDDDDYDDGDDDDDEARTKRNPSMFKRTARRQ